MRKLRWARARFPARAFSWGETATADHEHEHEHENRHERRGAIGKRFLVLVLVLVIGGCGFRGLPVFGSYGPSRFMSLEKLRKVLSSIFR